MAVLGKDKLNHRWVCLHLGFVVLPEEEQNRIGILLNLPRVPKVG